MERNSLKIPGVTRVTLEQLAEDPRVDLAIRQADKHLEALGYTEHGKRHVRLVAEVAGTILRDLGYPERTVELAEIAGFLHDIGNLINRENHAQTGAILAQQILSELGMPFQEVIEIMVAIGNHHEEDGYPTTSLCAALILADKADVHRSRVRPIGNIKEDIHDRVNYAATRSRVEIDRRGKVIKYKISIDTKISTVMEYFQIFLSRMLIASRAAKSLGCGFELFINNTRMS